MKKKVMAMLLAGSMIMGATSVCQAATETNTETVKVVNVFGEDEVELEYPEVPQRVVSLAGFATEMLLALGLEDHIVGYAWQDNEVLPQYKEAFEQLEPLCKPAMDPGEEKVLSVNPDLVLSWASWDDSEYFNYKNLAENGINAYGFHCERWSGGQLEDVYTDFMNIGKIFRVEEKANALVEELRTNIEETASKVAEKEPVSVFVCDASSNEEACMTVGGGLPQDLIEKAGGKNIVTDGDTNWIRGYSWEKIIAADPEWIVVDYYASADEADVVMDLLKTDPKLSQMKAVKEGNIVLVGLTELSCSERIDECVAKLAEEFHGVK
ncbi:MAG: ABC transporter substrate-binding protein [Eubacteriales bacterium]|nr:ABC transporter substrate-binding protein [Eubacteriales bacterium]